MGKYRKPNFWDSCFSAGWERGIFPGSSEESKVLIMRDMGVGVYPRI
jgi:hypothetical protein